MNKIYTILLGLVFCLPYSPVFSQANFPDDGALFRDDMVPRVDISINPDTLAWIYENVESNILFHADFIYTTDTIRDTVPEVGFRLRGNTSRNSDKKSFKVSFNTFHSGRHYFGVEKLNLNGEHNDPSVIRSKVSWDLMRSFGIPAPRSNHMEVYINGDYYGLYINVEQIDEEFVESRFDNKNGNLYKCLWPADLAYRGSDGDDYKHQTGDRRVYDLKTNVAEDDYSDLAFFIEQLNQLPAADFTCEFIKDYNVYDYLRVIAMDVFLGNWDGPLYNKNNFYLYYNTQYDRMEYIPYDLDNTLGIDWIGRDWSSRDMYDWAQHEGVRPLYSKMMENDKFREIYTKYSAELMSDEYTGPDFINEIYRIKDMITPYIQNDPYYPLDYGYSINDFHNSYQNALGGHVSIGLIPYIESRRTNTNSQLEEVQEQAVINHIRFKVKNEGANLRVRAYVREEVQQVQLAYTLDGGAEQLLNMFDDGEHNDVLANDGVYANTIADIPLDTEVSYYIKAKHINGVESSAPCDPIIYHYKESTGAMLVINEFMASNDTTIADEYGDYGDWIEIYNAGDQPIYLGDKYLTDDLSDENKWQMPGTTLVPDDFVLFWADDDNEKGDYHTNFKLSSAGEEIGIFDAYNTGYAPLDTLVYGAQQTDVSQGRVFDGSSEWTYFVVPTPGVSNVFDAIEEIQYSQISFYPNPNSGDVLFFSENIESLELYNTGGQLLLNAQDVNQIRVSHLTPGLYLLKINQSKVAKLVVR